MELKRINYSSAVYFAVVALVMYLVTGILQIVLLSRIPTLQSQFGYISPVNSLITAPIIGCIIFYLVGCLMIAIYNFVARKFPISWNIK
jgi:hypothetical protein